MRRAAFCSGFAAMAAVAVAIPPDAHDPLTVAVLSALATVMALVSISGGARK